MRDTGGPRRVHVIFVLLLAACSAERRTPEPTPPPPIIESAPAPATVPPTVGPFDQLGDFRSFWCGDEFYIIGDQEFPRDECFNDYLAHGYRDVWVTVTRDRGLPGVGPFDYLADVDRFRALALRFLERGLRVHPVIGCEDAESMCRRHHGTFPDWLRAVDRFVQGTQDLATTYVIGVEIREWASWYDSIAIAGAVTRYRPVVMHFGQGQWGPSSLDPWAGGRQIAYWRRLLQVAGRGRVALGYQVTHARREDAGGGFISRIEDVDEEIRELVERLAPLGVPVIASEYAYRMPEAAAAALGRRAKQAGATGVMNGF